MRKIWLVAQSTYRRRVWSGGFLGLTLGLPLLMVIAGAVPFWLATRPQAIAAIGVVDQTGALGALTTTEAADPVSEGRLTLVAFADVAAATDAHQRGAIAGFLVIPPGYFTGEQPSFYGTTALNAAQRTQLAERLRRVQLPAPQPWLPARLTEPTVVTYVDVAHGVRVAQGAPLLLRAFLPSVLALGFALIVFTGAGQMGAAMVREKEQRALEMVLTSLSIRALVAGKVLGMALLSLTQIGVWLLGAILALTLAFSGANGLPPLSIPWGALGWALLLCGPAYLLYAMLSAGLGIIAGDSQQAQQLAGMLGFFALAPFWLLGLLVNEPDGTLAVALTLFPLTAPMFSLVRLSLTTVPLWQLVTALLLLVGSLFLATWAVARLFRTVMLLYGQRIRLSAVWQALRTP